MENLNITNSQFLVVTIKINSQLFLMNFISLLAEIYSYHMGLLLIIN